MKSKPVTKLVGKICGPYIIADISGLVIHRINGEIYRKILNRYSFILSKLPNPGNLIRGTKQKMNGGKDIAIQNPGEFSRNHLYEVNVIEPQAIPRD